MNSALRWELERVILKYCEVNGLQENVDPAVYYRDGGIYDNLERIVEEVLNGHD